MNTILQICAGILLARLIEWILYESYRLKWQRVRLEFKRIFCCRQRQTQEIKVPRSRKRSLEDCLP